MTVSPETLLAFVEGDLSPEEARRVAAEVANDRSLAVHVENHKMLKARMQAASLPTPLPEDASKTLVDKSLPEGSSVLQPRPDLDTNLKRPGGTPSWITAGAMAVGIALGILLTFALWSGSEIRGAYGAVWADGALDQALSTVIGVEQSGAAPMRIGDTFFSIDGHFCRNFTMAGTGKGAFAGFAGIACREGEEWRIRLLTSKERGGLAEEFKVTPLPAALRDTQSTMMTGQPLDAEGERTARAQSWLVH